MIFYSFQNLSKELYDKRHHVSLMLTLFLYSSSLTNLQKSQWQLANNIHVTLLLILTNPTTSSNNSYFYEDEDKETLSRLSWSASNNAHCSYIYSECHVLRYHYLWHLNEVDKFSNKAVLSANWPCVQALRMRISERVRFFPVPRLSLLTCGWKNLSPLYHISASSSIRIRHFSFFWFVDRNLVEKNASPRPILVFLCFWGLSNFSLLTQKAEFQIWR